LYLRKEQGSWRKLRSEELHYLYCPSGIAAVCRSRVVRGAVDVALGGGGGEGFDREHVTERDFLEGLGVDKRGYIEMVVRK